MSTAAYYLVVAFMYTNSSSAMAISIPMQSLDLCKSAAQQITADMADAKFPKFPLPVRTSCVKGGAA